MRLSLSVVVPIAPGDEAWQRLALDLHGLPKGSEILFVGPVPPEGMAASGPALMGDDYRIAWVRSPKGRARQLNAGARAATGRFLWFVHADSRFGKSAVRKLERALRDAPGALHYFDLVFLPDGPASMILNQLAVRVRSRLMGMPFGDQGLCISKEGFDAVSGFDESAAYGEDHLFVWKAARAGFRVRAVGAELHTSARKYRDRGWLRTTAKHVYLTYKQAIPEWVATRKSSAGRSRSS